MSQQDSLSDQLQDLAVKAWENQGMPITSHAAKYIDAMLPSEAEEFGEECFVAGFKAAWRLWARRKDL